EMDLGPYVEWAGQVPFEMLRHIYQEVDLFLYPSLLEGFGLPVLEAFASGVPVVTSNSSSLPEVAGKAALLVDRESPKEMAGAIRRVIESKALRKKLIHSGLKRARQFSWDKMAKETLEVYEEMALR